MSFAKAQLAAQALHVFAEFSTVKRVVGMEFGREFHDGLEQEKLPETQGARRGDAVAHSRANLATRLERPQDETKSRRRWSGARKRRRLLQSTLQPHYAVAAAALAANKPLT